MTARRASLLAIAVAAAPAVSAAQAKIAEPMPASQQIAAAILPLPTEFRDGATVLGYRSGSAKLVMLREGKGAFVCLAPNPATPRFHVACYHNSLEPFMARGRALREQGVPEERVDTVRFAEIKSGKLAFPKGPAALYQLNGPAGTFDPTTGTAKGAIPLSVVYISGATGASTGLSEKPVEGMPWIMFPGTPKAHIMLVPRM